MPTLDELIAQHQEASLKYGKLFAASQAIAKRLNAARLARKAIRTQIHPLVGVCPIGTLVMTLKQSRFYEIESGSSEIHGYRGTPVYKHTGATKTVASPTYGQMSVYSVYIEAGSVLPVPVTHAVYLKWHKQKFRAKLEGAE